MSTITKGHVPVILAGTEYVLKPTLQAFSQLSNRYENPQALLNKIGEGNIAAMIFTLRVGLGWTDAQAKELPELVMLTGQDTLREPVSNYVFRLFHGGKSIDEFLAEHTKSTRTGDAAPAQKGAEGDADPLLAG